MTQIKVVNGKIQYFIKGKRVKPQEYYRFRSDYNKKNKFTKKTIIFSPSAASFDNFKNFEERGFYFNKLVKKYLNV